MGLTGSKGRPDVRLERLSPATIEEVYNIWADEDKYPIPKDLAPTERKKIVRHLHKVIGWITCLRPDHVLLAIDNKTDRVVGSADWIIVNPELEKKLWRPGMPRPCYVPRPSILINDEGHILEIHELTSEKAWSNPENRMRVEQMMLDRIVEIATEAGRKLVRWYVEEKRARLAEKAGFSRVEEPERGIWLMAKKIGR